MTKTKKQVVIGVTHQGEISSEMGEFLFQVPVPEEYQRFTIEANGTTPLARNNIVRLALERPQAEWFLLVDQYQDLNPWSLKHLIQTAKEQDIKVLSPLTFAYRFKLPIPVTHDIEQEVRFHNLISSGQYKMNVIPTQCVLVHRSVFEVIDPPWFQLPKYENKVVDEEFSAKCREAGFDLYLDEDVLVDNNRPIDLADYYNVLQMAIQYDEEELCKELHMMIWNEDIQPAIF